MNALCRTSLAVAMFVVPFAVHAAYQPLNAAWTVRRFGCGCPPLHGTAGYRFDANDFNAIGWSLIFTALGSTWWWITRAKASKSYALSYALLAGRFAGVYAILYACISRFALEIWL